MMSVRAFGPLRGLQVEDVADGRSIQGDRGIRSAMGGKLALRVAGINEKA